MLIADKDYASAELDAYLHDHGVELLRPAERRANRAGLHRPRACSTWSGPKPAAGSAEGTPSPWRAYRW